MNKNKVSPLCFKHIEATPYYIYTIILSFLLSEHDSNLTL